MLPARRAPSPTPPACSCRVGAGPLAEPWRRHGVFGSVPRPLTVPRVPPPAAGPPVIVVPPQNITVNISQDAFLACQAEAYPGNLTYTWFQGSSNVFHLRYGGDAVPGVAPRWPRAPGGRRRRGDLAESPTAALGHGACRRALPVPGACCHPDSHPLVPSQPPPGPGAHPGGREPPAATSHPGRRRQIHLHRQQRALEATFSLSLRHGAV